MVEVLITDKIKSYGHINLDIHNKAAVE